jgi:hypothetical protein
MSFLDTWHGERRLIDCVGIAGAGAVLAGVFGVGLYGVATGFLQTKAYFHANDVVSLFAGLIAAGCAFYLILELTTERRGRLLVGVCVICGTFGYFTVAMGVPAAVTNAIGTPGRAVFTVERFEPGGRGCSRNVVATNPDYRDFVMCVSHFPGPDPRPGQHIEVYGRVSNWGITREDYRLTN